MTGGQGIARQGILAFDIAKQTGVAFATPDRPPVSQSFALAKGTIGDDPTDCWLTLMQRADDLITVFQPKEIWFEAPVPMTGRSLDTEWFLMGAAAYVAGAAKRRGVPWFKGHVGQIRKAVLGTSRFTDPKRAVMDWCQANGWAPVDDNAADAHVVLAYAAACDEIPWELIQGDRTPPDAGPIFRGARRRDAIDVPI